MTNKSGATMRKIATICPFATAFVSEWCAQGTVSDI